jgi:hypothetical protein
MRWLPYSPTTTTPLDGMTATPHGKLKLAAAPAPSANAALPLPASVVTKEDSTSRMQLLPRSATTITPLKGFRATPHGKLKLAAVPQPFANAALPLPARVVTTPRGVMSRMRLVLKSPTITAPLDGITATPNGDEKLAAAPSPLAKVALPLPASVVTMALFVAAELPTTSASDCGDVPPSSSPVAPHSRTAAEAAGAAHFTHALALKAVLLPLGSADGALAPAAFR